MSVRRAVIVSIVAVALASGAWAQESAPDPAPARRWSMEKQIEVWLGVVQDEMALSDETVERLRPILVEFRKGRAATRKAAYDPDHPMPAEKVSARNDELRRKREQSLREVFNPAQYETYQELLGRYLDLMRRAIEGQSGASSN